MSGVYIYIYISEHSSYKKHFVFLYPLVPSVLHIGRLAEILISNYRKGFSKKIL